MDKDKFFERIEKAPPFEKRMKQDLEAILGSSVMLSALGEVMRSHELSTERFRELEYHTNEGVSDAIRLQGMGDGVVFVIEHLVDLVPEENEDAA